MYAIVFVTCKNKLEANKISKQLLKEKLIACCNIVSDVNSLYWWQGKVHNDKEVLMILKTRRILMKKIIVCVKKFHSYTVPEIVALPIVAGNPEYLKWINDSTKGN